MRPGSIILFERLYLAMVVLGLVNNWLTWDGAVAELSRQGGIGDAASTLMGGVILVSTGLYLLLWYLIARRASRVAKWIYVALVALSAANVVRELAAGRVVLDPATLIALVVLALMIGSAALLFRADARAWFSGGRR